MKVLNLYAGIGGNRKLWNGDKHDITHVEIDQDVAKVLRDNFPEDEIIIGDAHQYLKENFEDYDFIWASPPCPTHSSIRKNTSVPNGAEAKYPDMKLWQEILFLQGYFNGQWVVENVITWYQPMIKPQKSGNHYFWSNFSIPEVDIENRCHDGTIKELEEHKGFCLDGYTFGNKTKEKVLRNCVHSKLGLKIFQARNKTQSTLNEVIK